MQAYSHIIEGGLCQMGNTIYEVRAGRVPSVAMTSCAASCAADVGKKVSSETVNPPGCRITAPRYTLQRRMTLLNQQQNWGSEQHLGGKKGN